MDWLLILLAGAAGYAVIAAYLKTYHIFPDNITFYGPILGIKTDNVAFFDWFRKYAGLFRLYGTAGVFMVIIVSVLMVLMLTISFNMTLELKPEPTAIHKPQNILLIPGVNEFVPSTVAVWLAFILTLVIHEFGHAILCRVERIAVKSMGILLLVIPLGAFVEPDEEEVNKAASWPRMRMYGAGIMNNMVAGILCFGLMILMIGWAVPTEEPVVVALYKDFPAANAEIPTPSIIRTIDNTPVSTTAEVSDTLNQTAPGDTVTIGFEHEGRVSEYNLVLAPWPEELDGKASGFMGVYYYNGAGIISGIQRLFSPIGLFYLLSVPFNPTMEGQYLRILGFDIPDTGYYTAPFPGYWEVIHLLFWGGFINFAAGLFNALPMLPLDGGLIFREGLERLLSRRGLEKYAGQCVGMVSSLMLVMMLALFILPYVYQATG